MRKKIRQTNKKMRIYLFLFIIIFSNIQADKEIFPQITKNKNGTLNYIKDTKIPSFFKVMSGAEDIVRYYSHLEIYNESNIKIAELKIEKDYSYIKALIPILPEEILYKAIILKEPEKDNVLEETFFVRPEGIMKGILIMKLINKSSDIIEGDLFTEEGEIIEFEYPTEKMTNIYTDGRKSITELKDGKMITKSYDADGNFTEEVILKMELVK